MTKKYIKIKNLSVSLELANFVNKDLLPGTGVLKNKFWSGLDKHAHKLSLKNKNLLEFREILQKKIDIWHRDKRGIKINSKKYLNFFNPICDNFFIKNAIAKYKQKDLIDHLSKKDIPKYNKKLGLCFETINIFDSEEIKIQSQKYLKRYRNHQTYII